MSLIRLPPSFLFLLAAAPAAFAAEKCAWRSGDDLFRFDPAKHSERPLSAEDVQGDLDCLRTLYRNFYVAQEHYPEIDLVSRIDSAIRDAAPESNLRLMDRMFAFHGGMYDLHLGFSLGDESRQFDSKSRSKVALNETLESEKVVDRGEYAYFRPGDLFGALSPGQRSFVDFVAAHDQPIVLDLRQIPGGDDAFTVALAENLFTPEQRIPSTDLRQVDSLLVDAGLVNIVTMLHYRGVESFVAWVKAAVKGKAFADLLPYRTTAETRSLKGKRPHPFLSRIVLITDGGCASSCETIVEKLGAHPNAVVIGGNTKGAMHFSNPMTFQLPRSGILVRIPSLSHRYERDAPEGEGYAPTQRTDFVDLSRWPDLR